MTPEPPRPDTSPLLSAVPVAARPDGEGPPIDRRRFRKLRWFLARTFVMAFWHDFVLNRPLLRWLRSDPLERWQGVARRYRRLAVEMGGVLIKLGQFLSIRVDVLPPEVTRELAGLQDEVPPEPYERVVAQVEEDFDRPLGELFERFDREPMGAASLAQVHAARLPATALEEDDAGSDPEVVVKVLRPGIDVLVETDLKALRLAVRWLRPWKRLRRRVDLERLADEVTTTTRAELDLPAEGRNAERFAHDFRHDAGVRIPAVHWRRTAGRTLTLENVAHVKIGDAAALEAAGVARSDVAKKLYRTYMEQIFVHHFVHADPHPGNLFVRPLEPGDAPPDFAGEGRPFELVFVDFGMVAAVPPRLRDALREFLYGLGTRDSQRMVRAADDAGVLLPGADLERLVEVHEDVFQRLWGVSMGDMRDVALSQARYFLREYRDLLFELPFQVQVDLLFVSRAVGILAGLSTSLDPDFDPWSETIPFAEELAAEEMAPGVRSAAKLLAEQAWVAVGLPKRLDDLLLRSERGNLVVQARLSPELQRTLGRIERAARRLSWTVGAVGLLVAGVLLRALDPSDPAAPWLLGGAAVFFLWGLVRGR